MVLVDCTAVEQSVCETDSLKLLITVFAEPFGWQRKAAVSGRCHRMPATGETPSGQPAAPVQPSLLGIPGCHPLFLHAEAPVSGVGAPISGKPRKRKKRAGAPLTPAATAMAMLPGGEASEGHAPAALAHLLQPGSTLWPLYEVCGTCEVLVDTLSAANNVRFCCTCHTGGHKPQHIAPALGR